MITSVITEIKHWFVIFAWYGWIESSKVSSKEIDLQNGIKYIKDIYLILHIKFLQVCIILWVCIWLFLFILRNIESVFCAYFSQHGYKRAVSQDMGNKVTGVIWKNNADN